MDPIEQQVREFISKEFMDGTNQDFDGAASLLETGMIDSIGLFRLIFFIEDAFRTRVPEEDLLAENFSSLNQIVQYVKTLPNG